MSGTKRTAVPSKFTINTAAVRSALKRAVKQTAQRNKARRLDPNFEKKRFTV